MRHVETISHSADLDLGKFDFTDNSRIETCLYIAHRLLNTRLAKRNSAAAFSLERRNAQ